MKSAAYPDAPRVSLPPAASLFPDVCAGLLSALVALCYSVGYSAMIFSGSLAGFLSAGMPAVLICCVVAGLVIACASSLPFAIGGPDSNAVAILVGLTTGIAGAARADGGSGATVLATVLAALALGSALTGAIQYALGAARRSSAIQFLPFPVLGGFLGGTGYLLASGSFRMLTGTGLHWDTLAALAAVPWIEWLPAVVTCATLLILARRVPSIALLPAGLGTGALVFFAGLHAGGMPLAAAHRLGLLFDAAPLGALNLPERLSPGLVDWRALAVHLPEFVVLAVVASITILLNVSSLGLAAGKDIDLDRELRAAGIANLLSALSGGIVGYQSLSRSLLNLRAGATGRASGLACALGCLAAIACAPALIGWLPKPVLIGLQFYLAIGLLREWLIAAYAKLSLSEYLLIPLIVVVIAVWGVVAGVGLGIVAACVLFVLSYSRISAVRSEFDGMSRHSNVERSIDDLALLNASADQVVGLCLQGFLFFGTASSVLQRLRGRLAARPPRADAPRFVVVDFAQIDGLDASTSLTFRRLRQYCEANGIALVLTALPEPAGEMLARAGGPDAAPRRFADLDGGLEWVEEQLLAVLKPSPQPGEPNLRSVLHPHFSAAALDDLDARLERRDLAAGETLFRRGDPGDAVYLVERGRVTVSLPLDDARVLRLRSYGGGTIVGEMALYTQQPRSADVRADCATRVCRLSLDALQRLEIEVPGTAREFHRFVVRVLASRLSAANDALRALH
ncbi:cyclic nucleotide-binding protein [Burkholderia sp. WAC0059]|uniref:SulP family inorganic anion transporter n=1 Tax=Burkholderia sp. WAC0059 TaxID=2066022 RepID=UPI000C7EF54E|nr:SulP family inorganic anion transporter [Burkholderia sp. WAC0059]PLZ00635.1 cyclic nucleotide-binding protein [Burkholderia sp. WAC0059]